MRWDDQALNVTGDWWIHDQGDAVPGFLEEVPGRGLVLTVLGTISEPHPREPIPEVFGSAFSGVVLTRVMWTAEERSDGKARRQEFLVESALLRAQASPSSLGVIAGKVRFTGQQSWRPGSAFHFGYESLDVVTATFRSPPMESAAIPGGSVSLGVGERTHVSVGEIGIQAIPSFHITLDEPTGYNEFLREWVFPLRDLNSLVTSHPSAIVHLEVLPPDHDGPLIDVRGDPVEWDSTVQPPTMTALDLDLMRPIGLGFDFPPPSGISFQQLLENWWSFYARQYLALGQYFSSYYNSPPPESVRLLNHLVVLETFHHHKFPDAVKEPWEEFNERKHRILDPERWDGLDGDRAWLEGQHWELMNSLTLKSRLLELANLTAALNKVVKNWKQCCGQFAATRNYLAHGLVDFATRAIPPSEYEAATRLLDCWIRALFWTELGFSDSMVEHMLMRVESFAWLRSNIGQTWIRTEPEDDL